MILQVGMRVLIKDNKQNYNEHAGKIKRITSNLPDFGTKRAFGLDNQAGIWLIEDFEKCIDYPDLSME